MPPNIDAEALEGQPCDLTIAEAEAALRDGSLSAVALTESVLARIEETEPALNAYVLVTADLARERAARADEELASGLDRGPLHGIPFALKDLFDTAGIVTTAGSGFLRDRVPEEDAFVVAKLHEAGMVLTGKLGMHEFAFGTTSDNAHFGTIRNPWNRDYTPGGSSGGSGAAAAAGSALGTLGSDTGGSIRIPAAVCGVAGLKPTRGLVSRSGVFPLSHTLDHAGPLTRTVEDSALILNAIAGYDPTDSQSMERPPEDFTRELGRDLAGLRLGVPRDPLWANCDDEVVAVCEPALDELRALGAETVEVELPSFGASRRLVISPVEGAAFHAQWLRDHPELYSDEVRGKIAAGLDRLAIEYFRDLRTRAAIEHEVLAVLKTVDLLVSPTLRRTVPTVAEGDPESILASNTRLYNVSGLPAVSVPCGLDGNGLPVGLMIAGRPFAEATVCRAAHACEQATGWPRRPPLVGG
ncbi:MAG: amidase [Chloroflexi bacterium]|nr:amidase [Chloroflexota bacterium]